VVAFDEFKKFAKVRHEQELNLMFDGSGEKKHAAHCLSVSAPYGLKFLNAWNGPVEGGGSI